MLDFDRLAIAIAILLGISLFISYKIGVAIEEETSDHDPTL